MIVDAIRNGDIELVKTLINNGAAVDAVDELGRTAIMFASSRGQVEVVKMLLDNGAEADVKDSYDNTALMWACHGCHAVIVDLLLRHGASIEARNKWDTDAAGHLVASPCADEQKEEIRELLRRAGE